MHYTLFTNTSAKKMNNEDDNDVANDNDEATENNEDDINVSNDNEEATEHAFQKLKPSIRKMYDMEPEDMRAYVVEKRAAEKELKERERKAAMNDDNLMNAPSGERRKIMMTSLKSQSWISGFGRFSVHPNRLRRLLRRA